jgi:MoxR-like ATPase
VLNKVIAFREKQKERLTPEQVSRIPQPRYVPSGKEVVHAVASLCYGDGSQWEAPLLIGPKGSGKSTLAETLAAILYLPINKIFGGVDLNVESLLGGKTLVPDEAGVDEVTEAKLRATAKKAGIEIGPILEKLRGSQLKVGCEPGLLLQSVLAGEMIVADEVNMINPEVTSLLHGLLDWQKVLSVPGYGVVQADPNFRLIGCMNFGYAGTRPLNEAFQDRFRSVSVPHLPKEQLADLLVSD